jgi:hypothetical protein
MFCHDRRIRERRAIYVEPHIHNKLEKIVLLFHDTHVTMTSLASEIIAQHIEVYRPLLARLHEEQMSLPFNPDPNDKSNNPDEDDDDADERVNDLVSE